MAWQPDLVNPLMGEIQWPVPDNHTISVTLFKDPRTHELEDKDWTFVVEDVSGTISCKGGGALNESVKRDMIMTNNRSDRVERSLFLCYGLITSGCCGC